jgi:hypothetical protein
MSAPKLSSSGHSADVRIQLCVNGHVLPVAQLGPDFLILKDVVQYPPAEAELFMSIDGAESRWPVRLIDGIVAGRSKTRIGRCG